MGFYFREDSHSDVALAGEEVVSVGVEGRIDSKDLTVGKKVIEPRSTLYSTKGGAEELDSVGLELGRGFLGNADLLSVGGVVGHGPGAPADGPPPWPPSMA